MHLSPQGLFAGPTQAIATVIDGHYGIENSPGPLGPGELVFSVSNQ